MLEGGQAGDPGDAPVPHGGQVVDGLVDRRGVVAPHRRDVEAGAGETHQHHRQASFRSAGTRTSSAQRSVRMVASMRRAAHSERSASIAAA